jgi:CDP-diacylglycerol--glycerol-3-phosphate 3-phosphatidyltransferase
MSAVLVSLAAAALAWLDGRWLILAALVVVLSGLLDNLDGAVAVLTGRSTRWGYVLDSTADRVSDLAYVGALLLAGATDVGVRGRGSADVPPGVRARSRRCCGHVRGGVVTVWDVRPG